MTTISGYSQAYGGYKGAFSDCINLKYVDLPDSIINIQYLVFSNCTSLESISFPNSIEYLGSSMF